VAYAKGKTNEEGVRYLDNMTSVDTTTLQDHGAFDQDYLPSILLPRRKSFAFMPLLVRACSTPQTDDPGIPKLLGPEVLRWVYPSDR